MNKVLLAVGSVLLGFGATQAIADHQPNIAVVVDGRTYQCSGQSGPGGQGIFAVELYKEADCNGSPNWTVRNAASCTDPSRPDFWCRSAKIIFTSGTSFCMRQSSALEEDAVCRSAFAR